MVRRHSLFMMLLAAVLVGPAIYFNADFSNVLDVRNAGFSQGNVSGIPARTSSSFNLSPAGLTEPVSTVQVASPSFNNVANPARTSYISSPPAAALPNEIILPGNASGPDFNAVPLEFVPTANLGEIFRFDANPAWVKNRWSRVSNTRGNDGLTGMRVPLVTGVNQNDLFGSLTYYFDSNQVAQKITFRGWTGEPNSLVNYITSQFQLKQQPTSSAGLYVAKNWRKTSSALFMQHPNVIQKSNPTQQVAILMELNNPNGPFELSNEVAHLISSQSR